MGRVTGYNEMSARFAIIEPRANQELWSINLFQDPAAALESMNESPGMPEGGTVNL